MIRGDRVQIKDSGELATVARVCHCGAILVRTDFGKPRYYAIDDLEPVTQRVEEYADGTLSRTIVEE